MCFADFCKNEKGDLKKYAVQSFKKPFQKTKGLQRKIFLVAEDCAAKDEIV